MKSKGETEDNVAKDSRKGERESRLEELEGGQDSSTEQRGLANERDGFMRLLAP